MPMVIQLDKKAVIRLVIQNIAKSKRAAQQQSPQKAKATPAKAQ